MNFLRIGEAIAVFLTVIGLFFAGYFFLDKRHAATEEVVKLNQKIEVDRSSSIIQDLQLRSKLLDVDIKKDAETRAYYKDKEIEGSMDNADKRRLQYLEDQLDEKYAEQKILREEIVSRKE